MTATDSSRTQALRQHLPSFGLDAVALGEWIKTLPPALLQQIWEASRPREYRSGEVIFHKGEPAEGIYFIESGEVRASSVTEDGREFILYLFEPGSCVGIVTALDDGPSPSTCRAQGETRVRLVRRQDFQAILDRDPGYYRYFAQLMVRWVRGLLTLAEDQAVLGVRARLAKRLLQMAYIYGRDGDTGIVIPVKTSQEGFGLLLGATRQSVNHQLSDFRRQGWITVDNGIVTLLDTAALARCVNGRES